MKWPRDLVVRRPSGAVIRQPCADEPAVAAAIGRLARLVPLEASWTVEARRVRGQGDEEQ